MELLVACICLQSALQVEARNMLLFSKREAARAGIVLPATDARAQHISKQLKCKDGDFVRVGVANGLKVSTPQPVLIPRSLHATCCCCSACIEQLQADKRVRQAMGLACMLLKLQLGTTGAAWKHAV
jgi:hypothetical protein